MTENNFFDSYRQYFDYLERISIFGFNSLTLKLSRFGIKNFKERQLSKAHVNQNLVQYFGFNAKDADIISQNWLNQFCDAHLMFFHLKKFDRGWINKNITINDSQTYNELIRSGGIVLTFHTHFHNYLGMLLGIYGLNIYGIADAKNPEHDHPAIRRYHIDMIYNGTEKYFNQGRYLYFSEGITLLKTLRTLPQKNNIIVGLNDFPVVKNKRSLESCFRNKKIKLNSWFFDLIKYKKFPCYIVSFEEKESKFGFNLFIKKVTSTSPESCAEDYINFLNKRLQSNPSFWQGLEWIDKMVIN